VGGRWSRNAELSRTAAIAARGSQLIVGKRKAVRVMLRQHGTIK